MINESVQIVTLAEVKRVVKLNSGGKPWLSCKPESDGKPHMRIGPIYIWKILREGRDSAFPVFFAAVLALKQLFGIVSARLDECISKGSENIRRKVNPGALTVYAGTTVINTNRCQRSC